MLTAVTVRAEKRFIAWETCRLATRLFGQRGGGAGAMAADVLEVLWEALGLQPRAAHRDVLWSVGASRHSIGLVADLHEFVSSRVSEEVEQARRDAKSAVGSQSGHAWVDRLAAAMDKQELLNLAVSADHEERPSYALAIKRGLARSYSHHPDYVDEWSG